MIIKTAMIKKLKWGILGTGKIARKFAEGLTTSLTGQLVATGSRTAEAAEKFAADFPSAAHGSYDALLADPNVEAVYISTPHPMHVQWAVKAAQAGKHILCEKPIAMNLAEAESIVAAAKRHGVFLMEAFMYRCHPQTAKLTELIRSKIIGDVRLIQATLSFEATYDLQDRLFSKVLGGGAILDVGCYPASMSRLIAGAAADKPFDDPVEVKGCAEIGVESRVDEAAVATLKFESGILAQLACGLRLALENNVRIWGTKGSIVVPSPWFAGHGSGFSKIIIFKGGIPDEIVVESDRDLYTIEADYMAGHIAARQAPAMPWDDTLGNMRTLDAWRKSVGLAYDADKSRA
jgi:predicted dehydrogenase